MTQSASNPVSTKYPLAFDILTLFYSTTSTEEDVFVQSVL